MCAHTVTPQEVKQVFGAGDILDVCRCAALARIRMLGARLRETGPARPAPVSAQTMHTMHTALFRDLVGESAGRERRGLLPLPGPRVQAGDLAQQVRATPGFSRRYLLGSHGSDASYGV